MSRRQPMQKPVEYETDSDEEEEEEEEVDPCEKIQALPLAQRRRVYGLKALVKATKEAQKKKRARIAEIEKEFLAKMQPLFELRRKIVNGEHEPSAAEVARGEKTDESKVEEIPSDDEEEKPKQPAAGDKKKAQVVAPADEDESAVLEAAASKPDGGIPNFWLTVLKNNEVTEGMIMERDEPALRALTNVTTEFIDNDPQKGFKLSFHFAENAFFTNKVLTKTYVMDPEDEDEYALDDLKGTEIEWTSPANKLTVVIKQKKQRHKSGKGVRVVEREEKAPSFFHFFDPPAMPGSDDDEDEEDEEAANATEEIQMDFEAGQAFHEMIIPRAVYYYTGESIAELAAGMMGGMGLGDDDEEDEEEESDDDSDEQPAQRGGRGGARGGARGGRGRGNGEDCKQQ
uniref:Nucleosome assembly protein n=1 Tax=Neobodo designis TaxID=312471 RepID=A0A7S1MIW5_NEODS|mmetsp:Transcript_4151/g.13201  ORF Transcript_4151/g.13201 Transcript_4151/m.13201 type:complete len:400 (+) Transcript_4151:46-1245(+)